MKKLLALLLQGTGVTPFGPNDFEVAEQASSTKPPKKLGLKHEPKVQATIYPELDGHHYPAPPIDVFNKVSHEVYLHDRILTREIPFHVE